MHRVNKQWRFKLCDIDKWVISENAADPSIYKGIFISMNILATSCCQSYCQIWCMAKILSSHLSVRLFNNLYPILKFNVINNEC